jgi:putative chitinase
MVAHSLVPPGKSVNCLTDPAMVSVDAAHTGEGSPMLEREQVVGLYPRAPAPHVDAFVAFNDTLFADFGIAQRPIRLHYFLAQIGHESGGLTIAVENLSYSAKRLTAVWPSRFKTAAAAQPYARNPQALANKVYANRMGNGPPESGDGWRFRGRGYIQITGRKAYRTVGAIAGEDLETHPELAAAPELALRVACAFWQWKDLNPFCDLGDYKKVTRLINGGLNGFADRRAWLDKVRRMFARPEDVIEPPSPEVAVALQRALQARGYKELGAADGDIGRRTIAAIVRFREDNALSDGLIDTALFDALDIEPALAASVELSGAA